jgi:hypothetical protein
MRKSKVILNAGLFISLLLVAGFAWVFLRPGPGSPVNIRFTGFTNSPAGRLAVFAVSNRADYPLRDFDFYYVETHPDPSTLHWDIWAPLAAPGPIQAKGHLELLLRVPTNPIPWRIAVPYMRQDNWNQTRVWLRDRYEEWRKNPEFDFNRWNESCVDSDWVQP